MEHAPLKQDLIPARNAPLCEKCQVFFDHWYERPRTKRARWDVPNLLFTPSHLLNYAKSCPSCYIFAKQYLEGPDQKFGEHAYGKGVIWFKGKVYLPDRTLWLYTVNIVFENDKDIQTLKYDVRGDPENDEGTNHIAVRTSLRSDEEVALLRARSWIDKCTTSPSHAICRVQVTERTLPARFIHIPKDLHDICLHKAESIQTFHGLRYATLTHCWGVSAAPLLATKGNLDQMYQRIPFNALGKTFQDAISICQRLGLHYLWIDSLCIVQDDDSDWQNQAAAMGNIFAGCTINIVASASENGSGGCFYEWSKNAQDEFVATAKVGGKRMPMPVYASARRRRLPEQNMSTSERAWCFQERFLAPRSIYFHSDGLYWECRKFSADEVFPSGVFSDRPLRTACVRTSYEHNAGQFPLSRAPRFLCGPMQSQQSSAAALIWVELVQKYSVCNITYWKDRLIAFSGIARLICTEYDLATPGQGTSQTDQQYIAGLLYPYLREQLLWKARKPKARPEPCFAPSWSWASVHAQVAFRYLYWEKYEVNFTIKSARTLLSAKDCYGAVESGFIEIACNSLVRLQLHNQKAEDGTIEAYRLKHEGGLLEYSRVYLDAFPCEATDFFAMTGWKDVGSNYCFLFGLLLSPTESLEEFRRVGTFDVILSDRNDKIRMQYDGESANVLSESILPFTKQENQILISLV